jgi:hypothetical protein
MHLFTICPRDGQGSEPIAGIRVRERQGVLYIEPNHGYSWLRNALHKSGRPDEFILPVIPTDVTKDKFFNSGVRDLRIQFATLMSNDAHPLFLKETEFSEDTSALVSLELPFSHAQPYYIFSGNVKVLSSIRDDYYRGDYYDAEIEARDELCSGLVALEEGAGITFTYTNRYDQGKEVKSLLEKQFEYLWLAGKLIEPRETMIHKYHAPLNPEQFRDKYSDFRLG